METVSKENEVLLREKFSELDELGLFGEDNYDWLELDPFPKDEEIRNPLLSYKIGEMPDPIDEMIGIFMNADYLPFFCRHVLNTDLAPFQCVILDMLWNKKMPMLIGGRGVSKTTMLAVYICLRLIFHPGCKIVAIGAAYRQSKQLFESVCDIYDRAPVFRDIVGNSKSAGPKRDIDRCEFTVGRSKAIFLPIGNGEKIRGIRANYVLCDEIASLNEEVLNVVIRAFAVVSSDPIQKIKEKATINKLKKLNLWTPESERLYKERLSGNQIVFCGTAYYSFNHLYKSYKVYRDIITSRGDPRKLKEVLASTDKDLSDLDYRDYAIMRIPYTSIPESFLDPTIVAQAKATMSTEQFNMEFGSSFLADSNGFFKRSILEDATCNKPILVSTGERIQFGAMRQGDPKKVYTIGVDPAADQDNAAIVLIEMNLDHRKVVHCWTTNRKRYNQLKDHMATQGVLLQDDYYRFLAKKIRDLMRNFNVERIIMDKNGGGIAVAEALSSVDTFKDGELPIYTLIDVDKPKQDDLKKGLHMLELISPTADINSEANHGMLKDFQDKVLILPMFDSVEMAKSVELDNINSLTFDTYEQLVLDIEELKNEITTVVCSPSSILGRETFDTPEIKTSMMKKGRLRKDRYSALLYANYYARNKDKNEPLKIDYRPIGGTRDIGVFTANQNQEAYHGPGMLKVKGKDRTNWGSYGAEFGGK